ncbi:MAG: pilus assembly protein [Planctomycetaceae bacterium]
MLRTHCQNPEFLNRRRGVAAVEAAVTLPLLVALVFGSIEAANAIFLKQSMSIAVYEAVKVAASPQGDPALAELRCREVLQSRGITEYQLSITPQNLSSTTAAGTRVTVSLTVDADSSLIGPMWFFSDATLGKTASMIRL